MSHQIINRKMLILNKISLTSEAPFCASLPAFYTIEAALVIPIFTSVMLAVLSFFGMLSLQLQIQSALTYTVRQVGEYAYMENEEEISWDTKKERIEAEITFRKYLSHNNSYMDRVVGENLGISLGNSKTNGRYVFLKARYRMNIPLGLLGKKTIVVEQQTKMRKWLGATYDRSNPVNWVYITPTGKAYHRKMDCPYLDLSICQVNYKDIKKYRNHSGAKYGKCSSCGKNSVQKGIVYITNYGDVYHTRLSCRGLKRTVSQVELEKVGNRHACKKCAG